MNTQVLFLVVAFLELSGADYHEDHHPDPPTDDRFDLLHRQDRGSNPEDGTYVYEERNHHYQDVLDSSGELSSRFVHPIPQHEHTTSDGARRPLFSPHSLHQPATQTDHYRNQQRFKESSPDRPMHHRVLKAEDTYLTQSGHRMKKQPRHDCHDDALKACFPNKRGADFQQHVPVSVLARCLTSEQGRHRMPKTEACREFMGQFEPCVDDIGALCPNMNHEDTVECIDQVWDKVSPRCRSSDWYLHNFQHDYARKSPTRHVDHDTEDHLRRNHLHEPYTTPDVHQASDGVQGTMTVDGEEYFGEL